MKLQPLKGQVACEELPMEVSGTIVVPDMLSEWHGVVAVGEDVKDVQVGDRVLPGKRALRRRAEVKGKEIVFFAAKDLLAKAS